MPTVARDLMVPEVLKIGVSTPFAEIQHLFVTAGIYGAPVIDRQGAVVGIISAIDLLRAADQACDEDEDPGESHEMTRVPVTLTAVDIACPDAVWVLPDTPVDHVAQIMRREGVHRVLVGDDGHLEGILTTFDLLQAVRA